MEYGAIDLHKKESQIQIVMEDGEIVDRSIATTCRALDDLVLESAAHAHIARDTAPSAHPAKI